MPTRPCNRRHDGPSAAEEFSLGSLPVGSWFDMFDVRDQLVYRGVVKDQRTTWGYTVVMPVTEGEGNFGGAAESASLYRLYSMSDDHKVQAECPVTWLGVDEEVRATIESAAAVVASSRIKDQAANEDAHGQSQHTGTISLLPIVSLIPEEVYDDVTNETEDESPDVHAD